MSWLYYTSLTIHELECVAFPTLHWRQAANEHYDCDLQVVLLRNHLTGRQEAAT